MSKVVIDPIERTEEYVSFIEDLKIFHACKGTTLLPEPVLGGKKIDLFKLYKDVVAAGGFDQVTKKRSWKQIGAVFEFPATCTNSAYILKGLYIRNLLGWEEEKVWNKEWVPPEELKGPEAHKASTLAGKSYKKCKHRAHQHYEHVHHETLILPNTAMIKATMPHITNEGHHCEISERHHKIQPFQHVHSTESDVDRDCVTGSQFNESTKQRILPRLQSSNQADVDWALNNIVTISYECPQKLLLNENPVLLDLLLKKTSSCLQDTMFSESYSHTVAHKIILKILHIFRNFSFIDSNVRVLAANADVKQMLIKCLVMSNSAHYSHCIDILENMAPCIELGPFDSIIGCLHNLLMHVSERSVILGSIRILTILASSCAVNLHYLLPTSTQIASRVTQFLIANDEELIGASLEYLYQYSRLSVAFGQFLLELREGADIGIMVSLLMASCKYFRPLLTQSPSNQKDSFALEHRHHHHDSVPCMPNLASYQQLDEPYRCLGWLKDKFELSSTNNELSLDDMYLLYEMRFGHEKALRMKEFYTVLKIAFPITTESDSPQQGAILEGTTIRGLQVKMCILHDGSELMCQWTNCTQRFNNEQLLQYHVLHDHLPSSHTNCLWMDCDQDSSFSDPNELTLHIKDSHLNSYVDTSDIEGIALVAAQLLNLLSTLPNSHVAFMPYEQELATMTKKRPKSAPFIEFMFSNFSVGSCSSSCSSTH
ncbi:uncharacterized protein B0P05DRAFT_529586 [Gilbertella persicaria]|uniref:uncharacterized protein n=1 Tax=Gilbertella persicaria TaxID=101096 RepID=UPI0022204C93|nr:uncharacterized protein B0P05DRAFT_529586 [Gilbertella persicaria]KAI8090156.1 hypothetical protein B0P05DRAFT_529586 [Gilbertella persicaria]